MSAELKPRFCKKPKKEIIKSAHPGGKISVDFNGPLYEMNKYIA